MMKLLTLSLLLVSTAALAADAPVAGDWLLTVIEIDGEDHSSPVIMTFGEDGKITIGSWEYAKWTSRGEGRLEIASGDGDPLNGVHDAVFRDDGGLELRSGANRFVFERIDLDAAHERNEASGLAGCWEFEVGDHVSLLAEFSLPDRVAYVRDEDGVTDRGEGRWLITGAGDALTVMELREVFGGRSTIGALTADALRFETAEGPLDARRRMPDAVDHLDFDEDALPYDLYSMDAPLPWPDAEASAVALEGVVGLSYRRGEMIEEMGVLQYSAARDVEIQVDPSVPSVRFTHFEVTSRRREQFAEDYRGMMQEADNGFFPRDVPEMYAVTAKATVTVPAGTFECTVVDGVEDDAKVRLWMIDDLPGVYARIVTQGTSLFGDPEYVVEELTVVKR